MSRVADSARRSCWVGWWLAFLLLVALRLRGLVAAGCRPHPMLSPRRHSGRFVQQQQGFEYHQALNPTKAVNPTKIHHLASNPLSQPKLWQLRHILQVRMCGVLLAGACFLGTVHTGNHSILMQESSCKRRGRRGDSRTCRLLCKRHLCNFRPKYLSHCIPS